MRSLQVEIITRTVEIHRQKINRIEPILLTVSLRLHKHHFLGETIRRIRLFRISIPQIIFLERHRRKFGIGAHCACRNELTHTMFVCLMHEFHTHDHIVIEKFGRMFAVRADTAYIGGKMNNDHVLCIHAFECIRI